MSSPGSTFVPSDASTGSLADRASSGGAVSGSSAVDRTDNSGARARTVRGTSARGGSGRRGAGAATALSTTSSAPAGWQTWWARNRHSFLWDDVRDTRSGAVTVAAGGLSGRGRDADAGAERPSRATVYTRIVPLLLEQLRVGGDGRVAAAALISLGRSVDPDLAAPVEDAFVTALAHDELRVQLAATVGLGLLGTRSAGAELMELVACSQHGHGLVGRSIVPDRVRAVAALALALGDHPEQIQRLMNAMDGLPDSQRDLKAAIVTSLGLMPSARVAPVQTWLAAKLDDRRLDPAIQSAVPTALARHADPALIPQLLDVLDDRDADRLVQQSAVLALGAVADVSDADVLAALTDLAEDGRDPVARQFAWISLARSAARKGRNPPAPDALADARKLLVRSLAKPPRHADRPFVALAAGLFGRQRPEARATMLEVLLEAFDDVRDPDQRGALAVAMGLLGERDAGRPLREALDETRDESFAGHLAVALGLAGYREADAQLRELATRPGTRRDLRHEAALGLRLLGDRRAGEALSGSLADASSFAERDGLALALGALRDVSAVASLDELVRDGSADVGSRSAACTALGGLAEKTPLPWRARLEVDGNYVAAVADLDVLLDG